MRKEDFEREELTETLATVVKWVGENARLGQLLTFSDQLRAKIVAEIVKKEAELCNSFETGEEVLFRTKDLVQRVGRVVTNGQVTLLLETEDGMRFRVSPSRVERARRLVREEGGLLWKRT